MGDNDRTLMAVLAEGILSLLKLWWFDLGLVLLVGALMGWISLPLLHDLVQQGIAVIRAIK